jgi:hypothetical protein
MTKPLFARQPAELDFAPPGAGFIATRDAIRQPSAAAFDTLGDLRALPRCRPSRWRPILVIAALLAGAVALGALTGCAEDRGPQWIGDPLTLPDGSKIAAFDVLSRPDRLGLGQVDGVGLMQVDAGGHAAIVGWSTTQGQSAAGMIAQAAVSGATGLAGSGIVGGLTKQGLSTVSSAISSMKPPAVQVDLPKSAAGL